MALTRCQISIQGVSGLATDRFVNTFYVATPPLSEVPNGTELQAAFQAFYTTAPNEAAPAIGSWMAGGMFGAGQDATFKCYAMEDAKPRAPFFTGGWDMPLGTSGSLPTEVALCLSFGANPESGVVQARRRGRVYIGPLSYNTVAVQNTAGQFAVRPQEIVLGSLIGAGVKLAQDLDAQGNKWVVHSPTTGELAQFPVAYVSADNAFDTMRSRGTAATNRVSASVGSL